MRHVASGWGEGAEVNPLNFFKSKFSFDLINQLENELNVINKQKLILFALPFVYITCRSNTLLFSPIACAETDDDGCSNGNFFQSAL